MHSPLRIGILAPKDLNFSSWELRLFEQIASDSRFEIAALIVDGREHPRRNLWRNLTDPQLPGRAIRLLCAKLDERAVGTATEIEALNFKARLPDIPRIVVTPERRKFVDLFTEADSVPVRELNLDVLLRHAFGIIKGPILDAARHGIWSFHHADNRVNRGGPAGYWETVLGEPVTGATLQILTPELDGGRVIARCWQNTLRNAVRNQRSIFELANSLLLRELQRLARTGDVSAEPSPLYSGPLYVAPNGWQSMHYLGRRARNAAGAVASKIALRMGRRPNMWTLAVGKGPIETAVLWRTKEITPPANRYWADPFLIERDRTLFVLFEEYDYNLGRAWIAAGRIVEEEFEYLGVAIDAGYHMSFPFVFEHENEIYVIPETLAQRRVEVWRAVDFPLRWTLHRTALEGVNAVDTVLHRHENQWWMLTNISQTPKQISHNELHIFAVDGPKLRSIVPHQNNPVVIDTRTARNGGRPFYRKGRLYRPSQNGSYGVYGYGFNLMEVTALTLDHYQETIAYTAEPNFRPGIVGTHHFDAVSDTFIIDVCRAMGGK